MIRLRAVLIILVLLLRHRFWPPRQVQDCSFLLSFECLGGSALCWA